MNRYGRRIWGDHIGEKCFAVIQSGQTGPCDFCSNDQLLDADGKPTGPYVWEFQNTVDHEWYECRDEAISWPDGRIVRLEIAMNITERKRAEEALNKQLEELQRWHSVTLGREDRIREIKQEVNELLARLGEPLRYSNQKTDKANEKLDGFDNNKE